MKHVLIAALCLLASNVCTAQKKVQETKDYFPEMTFLKNYYAKFSLDEQPRVVADTDMIAIWKMKEDVDQHNYFVVERYAINQFVATYMNRGGSNRTYENFGVFISKIDGVDFLNVSFRDMEDHNGYFFVKVTDLDPGGWHMTLSLVKDTKLKDFKSREELREYIRKHMNEPGFYGKPVHFDKKLPLMYCK